MIPGLRGTLLSHDALEGAHLTELRGGVVSEAMRAIGRWHVDLRDTAGPTWPARLVFDRIAVPFCRTFGLEAQPVAADADGYRAVLTRQGRPVAPLLATGWGRSATAAWRPAIRLALTQGSRWAICFTGPVVCLFDAARTHSRRHVEIDLSGVATYPDTFAVTWYLLTDPSALQDAVALSERHRVAVRDGLQSGVRHALAELAAAFAKARRGRRARADACAIRDESLTVIYRILFLLFAEARGLVPLWHPVYRQSYTLESLRDLVETLPRPRGLWEGLQAIARLAHAGCRAGALRVPPFNGRLFSPAHAPLAEAMALDDSAVRGALLALTTRKTADGRQRIAYGDLGVEHLGGVYERVLDYDVSLDRRGSATLVSTGRRKSSGSFYTPRSMTEYLVRRTLAPLVEQASADDILELKILDPAMGSGAFLVAACRYLAAAYETALVREGALAAADITDADRVGFRRAVAQRTLFGVDLNPMSVQLARLSLWLATLSDDRPLTFFDHHLRAGNSLVGASIAAIQHRSPGRTRRPPLRMPLFEHGASVEASVGAGVASGRAIGEGMEETIAEVRAKESLFARMQSADAPLAPWKAIADLWCGAWFDGTHPPLSRGAFAALVDRLARRGGGLADGPARELLQRGRQTAVRERFFHWELEFPELFYSGDGHPLERPGFDAILGNPPWEVLRGDAGDDAARATAAGAAGRLTRFARGSGLYPLQGSGHANLYQLFVERSLMLLRRGGRLGLILPWGFASDHGCASLRRHVLASAQVDSFVAVENREALFPIHRALKFLLLTLTGGGATERVPLRTGVRSATDFESLPGNGPDPQAVSISLGLIAQLSGRQLAVPELRTATDAAIVGRIAFEAPAARAADGWGLEFGRELNATEDRRHFNTEARGLPVIEGKHLRPFAVDAPAATFYLDPSAAARLPTAAEFQRPRLAYRDVASSTNRLTLIAAVLPAGTATTHTLFCLKTPLDEEDQHFLAGMFNSFVANYLARLRVTTHVTVAIVERLPLPRPPRSSSGFTAVVELARHLASAPSDTAALARLQAEVARIYALRPDEFEHVLSTFPLVDPALREAALKSFLRTV